MEILESLFNQLVEEYGNSLYPLIMWIIIKVVTKWKLFGDVGEKKWKALIPYYSTAVQFQLVWKLRWFLVCMGCVIPVYLISKFNLDNAFFTFVNSVLTLLCVTIDFMGQYRLGRAFGKSKGFSICLGLFNPIFSVLLAFTDHQYSGPYLTKEKNRKAFEEAMEKKAKEWGIDDYAKK